MNFVIAQKARVYRPGTSPSQHRGWDASAFGGTTNQDSEVPSGRGKVTGDGGEGEMKQVAFALSAVYWRSKGGRVERVKRCAGVDMKGNSEPEVGSVEVAEVGRT